MKRPHFYYKVSAEIEAGKALKEFLNQCDMAAEAARQWVEAQGATSYYESPEGMAGGVAAVVFDNCISKEGWEKVMTRDGSGYYFVPTPDTEIENEMYALPIVGEGSLFIIMHSKPIVHKKSGKALPMTFGDETPILFAYDGSYYIDMPYESEAEGIELVTEALFNDCREKASE